MNRTNRIRIFFCATAFLCCSAYYTGYRYTLLQENSTEEKNSMDTELPSLPEKIEEPIEKVTETDSVQSANPLPYFTYAVVAEEGFLTVYEQDLTTVFLYTGISYDSLPASLQGEIDQGKLFATERELYEFLENYSS